MFSFFEKYIPFITLVISAISVAIIVLVTSKVQSLEIQFGVLANEVNQYKNSLNHLYEVQNFHDEDQIVEPAPIDQPYVDEIERMAPIVPQQVPQQVPQPPVEQPMHPEQQQMPQQVPQQVPQPPVEQPMHPEQQQMPQQVPQQLSIPAIKELEPVQSAQNQQQ